MRVVVATHNLHKLEELRCILGNALEGIEVESYSGEEPVENGTSFAENGLIKARAAAIHTGLPAIADDSGLCVDVMGGSPGIFSARWSGPARDSAENVQLLLWQLSDVPDEHRTAHFACAAVLVAPNMAVEVVSEGTWSGRVGRLPIGERGFGYDPIFHAEGFTVSAAQMRVDEKNAISHRAQAFAGLIPHLNTLVNPQ
jgi:XTP/dITP diphosphohydrolase